ncbi:phage tail protein [Klebsiella sp. H-Nf2]|uniref:phage tail protein n=1 Tax=Klebsiella TaxID=570 RepID=UPI000C28B500|nr:MULTISPECIES: phage tail protein [Klebsiella]HDH1380606.1 phage tail protein [Klebsiella quasipneumoniae subsp. similipneumoniae]PJR49920.1 phage tail protein [Klebsiella sp. H-Nf2]SXD50473.1 putative prophage tail fiber protein [Klebsiella quasipneumoniae]HCT6261825.1 phage tail protein [Klebsiella quasipneumoniae]HDU4851316.1 phage tail protein [Klebsiella quasipneumoniae subsp. similipneumoniae]
MLVKFKSLITRKGRERIADAVVTGEHINFAQMAVGDGNGSIPQPGEDQETLVNERFRTQLNSLKIVDSAKNVIAAEMIIPPEVGGFTIREAALFDEDGVCMAVASVPETYKPLLAEGSGRFTIIRIWIAVESTDNIVLQVDPGIVLATVEDVINIGNSAKDYADKQVSDHAESRDHPDATLTQKGFTTLSNSIDSADQDKAATPSAVKAAVTAAIKAATQAAWELDNPVGTVRFFNQNINPNENWPWSEWVYTGENKTIRIAKADGSNVGTTGGSDTVTLQQVNLPAVQINVTGETSEQPARELSARAAGRHKHQGGMAAPGEAWDGDYVVGSDNDSHRTRNFTSEADDHTHIVDEPPHSHQISGKTDNLGNSQAISVVEAHILLMCWARVV